MKRIVILGGGISGVGAALLANKLGYDVFVSDSHEINPIFRNKLINNNIRSEQGGHSLNLILNADLVVKSPGIPNSIDLIKTIRNNGIEIISEVEFASNYSEGEIIAITGSNGKTTTTSLIYHILEKLGFDVSLVGNIGRSFAEQVSIKKTDYYILEVSSFQLDDINEFRPKISLILNISPDHLDRYNYKLENYASAKYRIAENQVQGDVCIYHKDLKNDLSLVLNEGVEQVLVEYPKRTELIIEGFDFTPFIRLIGLHNYFNTECAIHAVMKLGVGKESIAEALSDFNPVEHRLEFVREFNGVSIYNDSKATNVDAVFCALQGFKDKIIWLAGGKDKGNDYSVLEELVKSKVKALVCLGADNSKLIETYTGKIERIESTDNIDDAIQSALSLSEPGDVILLSPACASFDLFNSYEHRGKLFKQAVLNL